MTITAVAQQDQIEVYVNEDGEIVVRQDSGLDDPAIVLIAAENIERVIRALRTMKRQALERQLERAGGGN